MKPDPEEGFSVGPPQSGVVARENFWAGRGRQRPSLWYPESSPPPPQLPIFEDWLRLIAKLNRSQKTGSGTRGVKKGNKPPEDLREQLSDLWARLAKDYGQLCFETGHTRRERSVLCQARNADDRLGPFLEFIGVDGQYYWLPLPFVSTLEFTTPEEPSSAWSGWQPARLEGFTEGAGQGVLTGWLATRYPPDIALEPDGEKEPLENSGWRERFHIAWFYGRQLLLGLGAPEPGWRKIFGWLKKESAAPVRKIIPLGPLRRVSGQD